MSITIILVLTMYVCICCVIQALLEQPSSEDKGGASRPLKSRLLDILLESLKDPEFETRQYALAVIGDLAGHGGATRILAPHLQV